MAETHEPAGLDADARVAWRTYFAREFTERSKREKELDPERKLDPKRMMRAIADAWKVRSSPPLRSVVHPWQRIQCVAE